MSNNQTETVSKIHSSNKLDLRIEIKQANVLLPIGLHSYAFGKYKNKCLLIAGRSNGLHGFSSETPNFPARDQNTNLYVLDFDQCKGLTIKIRSLFDQHADLSIQQVDSLSVTSPQFYTDGDTLYITGGYGVDRTVDPPTFGTKPILTAINLPGLINWVENPASKKSASKYIKQLEDPVFKITGGYMDRLARLSLLVFGQTFEGEYGSPQSIQTYSNQVRRFEIKNNPLTVIVHPALPEPADPNYRRRDLSVLPFNKETLVAYSGVFTPNNGVWTVPVEIDQKGESYMDDPARPSTFKQGMNNYTCAAAVFRSERRKTTYTTLMGGISFGYFENGQFKTDADMPFINQCTTIKGRWSKKRGHHTFKQYLMDGQYPTILSTQYNIGNPLLFGAGAAFIPLETDRFINYDRLTNKKRLVGYIVGGIASSLPNTTKTNDSFASTYIFEVYARKRTE